MDDMGGLLSCHESDYLSNNSTMNDKVQGDDGRQYINILSRLTRCWGMWATIWLRRMCRTTHGVGSRDKYVDRTAIIRFEGANENSLSVSDDHDEIG